MFQDDSISDEEGIKKYAEYKLEFKRQQLNEFFVTHKEEEWFKQKYHPDDSTQRKEELKVSFTVYNYCCYNWIYRYLLKRHCFFIPAVVPVI
jgi:hypothetical protein